MSDINDDGLILGSVTHFKFPSPTTTNYQENHDGNNFEPSKVKTEPGLCDNTEQSDQHTTGVYENQLQNQNNYQQHNTYQYSNYSPYFQNQSQCNYNDQTIGHVAGYPQYNGYPLKQEVKTEPYVNYGHRELDCYPPVPQQYHAQQQYNNYQHTQIHQQLPTQHHPPPQNYQQNGGQQQYWNNWNHAPYIEQQPCCSPSPQSNSSLHGYPDMNSPQSYGGGDNATAVKKRGRKKKVKSEPLDDVSVQMMGTPSPNTYQPEMLRGNVTSTVGSNEVVTCGSNSPLNTNTMPKQQQVVASSTTASPKERRKHDRFNGMPEEEVCKRTLPDILAPNLDIVIIGINPGLFAAYKGHHYAGPGNHFWKCLYLSGLIGEQMSSDDDQRLLQYGIGFTNMVERATKGSSDLTRKEIRDGGIILLEKLQRFRPKIAVFNGKLIFEVFSGKKEFNFGKQPDFVENTNTYMWVMPSSSARCAQLPRASDKVPYYSALKKFRDYLNGIVPTIEDSDVVFQYSKLKPYPKGSTDSVLVKGEEVQVKEEMVEPTEEEYAAAAVAALDAADTAVFHSPEKRKKLEALHHHLQKQCEGQIDIARTGGTQSPQSTSSMPPSGEVIIVKKKRGRPKKIRTTPEEVAAVVAANSQHQHQEQHRPSSTPINISLPHAPSPHMFPTATETSNLPNSGGAVGSSLNGMHSIMIQAQQQSPGSHLPASMHQQQHASQMAASSSPTTASPAPVITSQYFTPSPNDNLSPTGYNQVGPPQQQQSHTNTSTNFSPSYHQQYSSPGDSGYYSQNSLESASYNNLHEYSSAEMHDFQPAQIQSHLRSFLPSSSSSSTTKNSDD